MRCPKCQRELEEGFDGDYICCANAAVRWRCRNCRKVSEGFAFHYGRCADCGGMLEQMAPERHREEAAALEGVRMAFEIELGGRAFYQRAAAETSDPDLKQLFGCFALMEGEHLETLCRRYHLDVPAPSPDFRVEVAAIFADVPNRPQDADNLFRIAIGLEKKAARFFSAHATAAPPGSNVQRLFHELAAEEVEHGEMLATEYERWRANRSGRFAAPEPRLGADVRHNAAAVLLEGHDPARAALVCGSETLSYGQLRERAGRVAAMWRARGIGPGERVAIKLPDGLDWICALLGTMWAGAVAVPVNPRIPVAEWHYILDEAGFSVILAESAADSPSPWPERTLLVDDFRSELPRHEPVAAFPVTPETPAFWCHSSGTSGKPKAVVHGHRFAPRIEEVSRDALGIRPDDRLYASSKLFFSYPQTNSLYAGLKLGATVIVDPQWPTAAGVAATVAAQKPTVLFSVPSLYRNLIHEGLAPRIAEAGVRLCVSAGEALPPSVRDEWRRQTGLPMANGYGASETLILVMIDHGDGRGHRPSPGVDIRSLDDAPVGAPTRLRIRASTVALGYLDRPQAQAEHFRDGAFCPADLFTRDETGGWSFSGREDSLVKIHGRWVNLVELEEKLMGKAGGLREGAAVCVPDADGVDAVAFFYASADADEARAALQDFAGQLPPHQRPRWWYPVDTLPRGPTGKLLRRKLRELHLTRV